jgi:anti-anti-sigma factor
MLASRYRRQAAQRGVARRRGLSRGRFASKKCALLGCGPNEASVSFRSKQSGPFRWLLFVVRGITMQALPTPDLRVEIVHDSPLDETTIVRASGEIDVSSAPCLKEAIDVAYQPGRHLIVDLNDVAFIDSSGVSVLVAAANRSHRDQGAFSVYSPNPNTYRIFTILGLVDHLGVTVELLAGS